MKKYLDIWTAEKLNTANLTREDIDKYQLEKLKETFKMATAKSPYYAELYKDCRLGSMEDFKKLPFTTPADVCEHDDIHPKSKEKLADRIAAVLDKYIG